MDTTTLVQPEISRKASEDLVGSSGTLEKEHDIISSEESPYDISNRVSAESSEDQDDPRREQQLSPLVSERTSQDDAASDGHHMQLYEMENVPQVPPVLKLPPVPDRCIQFQADWKSLRRNRNVLSQYFKVFTKLSLQLHGTGHSHLRSLTTFSMEIWRGRPGRFSPMHDIR